MLCSNVWESGLRKDLILNALALEFARSSAGPPEFLQQFRLFWPRWSASMSWSLKPSLHYVPSKLWRRRSWSTPTRTVMRSSHGMLSDVVMTGSTGPWPLGLWGLKGLPFVKTKERERVGLENCGRRTLLGKPEMTNWSRTLCGDYFSSFYA